VLLNRISKGDSTSEQWASKNSIVTCQDFASERKASAEVARPLCYRSRSGMPSSLKYALAKRISPSGGIHRCPAAKRARTFAAT